MPASRNWGPESPSLIERVLPAQKISTETLKEFDAHGAQTLTGLGSYWKGRKRLVYSRACLLGAILPATDDLDGDLDVFERLMGIDEGMFLLRERKLGASGVLKVALAKGDVEVGDLGAIALVRGIEDPSEEQWLAAVEAKKIAWRRDADPERVASVRRAAFGHLTYKEKADASIRPEELPQSAFDPVWPLVNAHYGLSVSSLPELVEQIGKRRFGRRPLMSDTFSGSGSIPYEAARIGCDVYASDLNPVACMLTWGAMNVVGGDDGFRDRMGEAQATVAAEVDAEIVRLGLETDGEGNRAKAYLYCLEALTPFGWRVPVLNSRVVSMVRKAYVRLRPIPAERRFAIEVVNDATPEELVEARTGTVQSGDLVFDTGDGVHRISMKELRGDHGEQSGSALRRWELSDIAPREGDVLGERLYCIQWMTAATADSARPDLYFRAPTEADLEREAAVRAYVEGNLADWQARGFVPDMAIEPGEKTDEPIRTRGWTHWHHLFTPRQLLLGGLLAKAISRLDDSRLQASMAFDRTFTANWSSRLSIWAVGTLAKPNVAPSAEQVKNTFYNLALNTLNNFGARAFRMIEPGENAKYPRVPIHGEVTIASHHASEIPVSCDLFVTDPPYADAVHYHEITEFFIAWLRRNPPAPFADWVWDSRRAMAIRGAGDDFRREMIRAYSAMAARMTENGLQIIMFTHQSGEVWADMASIMWASGLRVTAAWYISTETASAHRRGGFVQGTVTLVVRRRQRDERAYEDELALELKEETERQIETLVGLNQRVRDRKHLDENLFEDVDLQMAGYAAALRVLTGYRFIGGADMVQEAIRPRTPGQPTVADRYIEMAVATATEHLIPDGISERTWSRLGPEERFYLKMLDLEAVGLKKLDNYQNFAKAYRVPRFQDLMASQTANESRLLTAAEMGRASSDGAFGVSKTRALLYAVREVSTEADGRVVMVGLRDALTDYWRQRSDGDLDEIAGYVARKTEQTRPAEARAARIVRELISNDHI